MIRKGVSLWLIILLAFGSIVVIDLSTDIISNVNAITIYVDDDYGSEDATHKMTIQAAIDNASVGDTVYVYDGYYYENIIANKTINLTGEDPGNTTINGKGNTQTIYISSNWVNITGFTIVNGSYNGGSGIFIDNANKCMIYSNILINNYMGILLEYSNENYIINNQIFSNNWNGIRLMTSMNNHIYNNNISSNIGHGISFMGACFNNYIVNNSIISNVEHGIRMDFGNYNQIIDNNISNNIFDGIWISPGNENIILNNSISHNNQNGIYLNGRGNKIINNLLTSNQLSGIYLEHGLEDNLFSENQAYMNNIGIYLRDSFNNNITNNNIMFNNHSGLLLYLSDNNFIMDNNISHNLNYGLSIKNSQNNILLNGSYFDNYIGSISAGNSKNNKIINSSIQMSSFSDILMNNTSNLIILNSTFNKSHTHFSTMESSLDVQWYIHIDLFDLFGNPVPFANVKIEDGENGTIIKTLSSDGNGRLRWATATEYIEQDIDGDTMGKKTYHTPHKVVAWNDTLVGYAQPIMNESKTVTIVLGNGTSLDLEPGWNLVSLPRIQSNTNLSTVLQSIEGQYDAVQWYNVTDGNDPWKHNHISKPSNLNDLNEINHTMGLWVHVTDPEGATLVVFGDVLTTTQDIALHPGWNLVGYPSESVQNRTDALNNIDFGNDVDAIWTYNATSQIWKEITASDNFEVGRGYWMHSKVTNTWIVRL